MLAKINRITENREFLRIFKTVRPVHTAHLAIRIAKRDRRTEEPKNRRTDSNEAIEQFNNERSVASRFGFVISNKIDKRSARRNGLKRRIREVIEKDLEVLQTGIDVVIQVKSAFDFPYNYDAIRQEVEEGLKKAGILPGN